MAQKKRKMRELAMQVLFVWDANGQDDAGLAADVAGTEFTDADVKRGGVDMARGAWANRQVADAWVERLAPQWPPRRQPPVDRNLLRLAVWELTAGTTPPKVVIDEAIELAKHFSTEQSPAFVNGVLDAVLREHEKLTAGLGAATSTPQPVEKPKGPETDGIEQPKMHDMPEFD